MAHINFKHCFNFAFNSKMMIYMLGYLGGNSLSLTETSQIKMALSKPFQRVCILISTRKKYICNDSKQIWMNIIHLLLFNSISAVLWGTFHFILWLSHFLSNKFIGVNESYKIPDFSAMFALTLHRPTEQTERAMSYANDVKKKTEEDDEKVHKLNF